MPRASAGGRPPRRAAPPRCAAVSSASPMALVWKPAAPASRHWVSSSASAPSPRTRIGAAVPLDGGRRTSRRPARRRAPSRGRPGRSPRPGRRRPRRSARRPPSSATPPGPASTSCRAVRSQSSALTTRARVTAAPSLSSTPPRRASDAAACRLVTCELAEDVLHVGAHGVLRDAECGTDLVVAQPAGQLVQHGQLAGRERVDDLPGGQLRSAAAGGRVSGARPGLAVERVRHARSTVSNDAAPARTVSVPAGGRRTRRPEEHDRRPVAGEQVVEQVRGCRR